MLYGLKREGRIVKVSSDLFGLQLKSGDEVISGETLSEILPPAPDEKEEQVETSFQSPDQTVRNKNTTTCNYLKYQ